MIDFERMARERGIHFTQIPEYWEHEARTERAFAKQERGDRRTSVDLIQLRERLAKEYDAKAAELRAQETGR